MILSEHDLIPLPQHYLIRVWLSLIEILKYLEKYTQRQLARQFHISKDKQRNIHERKKYYCLFYTLSFTPFAFVYFSVIPTQYLLVRTFSQTIQILSNGIAIKKRFPFTLVVMGSDRKCFSELASIYFNCQSFGKIMQVTSWKIFS